MQKNSRITPGAFVRETVSLSEKKVPFGKVSYAEHISNVNEFGELFASLLSETLAAIYRSVITRLERNDSFLSAACAYSCEHFSVSRCVLLCISALLAALRLVCEALFRIEFLLTGGEYEFISAVLAYKRLVCVHTIYLAIK